MYDACVLLSACPEESQERPLFGMCLAEHQKLSKKDVAVVVQDCVEALRDGWLDTEGLFRIAGSAAKVKFLKVSSVSPSRCHDSHVSFSLELIQCPPAHC